MTIGTQCHKVVRRVILFVAVYMIDIKLAFMDWNEPTFFTSVLFEIAPWSLSVLALTPLITK